jgi:hypothetical protein
LNLLASAETRARNNLRFDPTRFCEVDLASAGLGRGDTYKLYWLGARGSGFPAEHLEIDEADRITRLTMSVGAQVLSASLGGVERLRQRCRVIL